MLLKAGTPQKESFMQNQVRCTIIKTICTSYQSFTSLIQLAKTEFPHDIIGGVECQECGPQGSIIDLKEHGIRINIPCGAIDRKVEMEFAVCLTGPFKFPANKRPVSPILWICTREDIMKFNKPIEVILPHIFPELSKQEIAELDLSFVKADHSKDYSIIDDGSKSYSFSEIERSDSHLQGGYGILNLNHCCYLCIQGNDNNRAIVDKAQYCLSQFHDQFTYESRNVVIFCATYSLKTCLKVYITARVVITLNCNLQVYKLLCNYSKM